MEILSINTKKLIQAVANAGLEAKEIAGLDPNTINTNIKLMDLPPLVLDALLRVGKLNANAKAAIRRLLGDQVKDSEFDEVQSNLTKFSGIMTRLVDDVEPTLEFDLGGKTYPIFVDNCHLRQGMFEKYVSIGASIAMMADGSEFVNRNITLSESNLANSPTTVRNILSSNGLRPVKKETLENWKASRMECQKFVKEKTGQQFICNGNAIKTSSSWWQPTLILPLGYVGRVVVEPDMETNPRHARYDEMNIGYKHLPLVRCFSLDTKEYIYVDVGNLEEYRYDTKASEKLVLPTEMKSVLTSLFNWNGTDGFGDIFKDRHGGVVVLAAGKPGVGKTLTAEVYAHIMKRPLYSIDLTELGTNVAQVEASLGTIFQRVTRWNAVLLLDEADIFMAERQKEELERSAIVGVFLRVLDRYKGTLFLTTNRTEVLDPAFASRITVKLDYPDLNDERRCKIWELMLAKAKIFPEGGLTELGKLELNGREIRNCVRLIRIIHPTAEKLSSEELVKIARMNVSQKSKPTS